MFSLHDLTVIVMLVLMLFANLGIKLYFKQRRDQLQLAKLEKQNLEQQLEYLKYQLNPHFLMNTLNNIHALVDIEPEEAKHSIVELSKMMRYVLYEGAKSSVPLQKDIEFLRNYVTLMKLRYTDKVSIRFDVPDDITNKMVPPMLLITFVENAFKHGVSYRNPSFIDIHITTSGDTLAFVCRNSKTDKEPDLEGGVGLKNTRQRLDLIYGNDYRLDIDDGEDTYEVTLELKLHDKP
jgi:LytS/YehU family sensor histidine kinase